ncbi:CPBP family intramembrane glutamic endopeptidase [Lihuaxuella thermophila]|uniref:CAAX prenyl protease 2/Lysostaphin resistance protein A-like domain-containing protein n=1 Tax=Lihuaxuella thermophila TaxID=1173111 RepID=A0A1H8ITH9_9BACL|nr:CPBP family intramembrane glutamic endopeptidase [Lihuaxuella thermophila]SEN71307.1 hypothetical protein SAMN05444955_11924 [Lihuaxuella thermophila]
MKILEVAGKTLLLITLIFILSLPGIFLIHLPAAGFVLQSAALLLASFFLYALFERNRKWPFGFKQAEWQRQFLEGAGFGAVLISVVFLLILVTGGVQIAGVNSPASFWRSAVTSAALFILVAVSEETLARGYVQGLMAYRFSARTAWIASSVFFALLHGLNPGVWDQPFSMLNIFLAGMLLAIYRTGSGGLWGPIGLHFTWNFFQGTVFGFQVSGIPITSLFRLEPVGDAVISGGEFGAEGSLFSTMVLIAGIYYTHRRSLRSAEDPGESGRGKD